MTRRPRLPLPAAAPLAALLLGAGLAGCKTSADGPTVYRPASAPTAPPRATNAPAANTPVANAPAANVAGNAAPPAERTPPAERGPARPAAILSLDAIPAALKTDAYEYYGLGRRLPITMTLVAGGQTKTGAQDVCLRAVSPGEARFEITSTDGLDVFGIRNVVSVRPEGIRIVESDVAKSGPNDYELPAGLVPGKVWVATQTLDSGPSKMKLTLTQRVVGTKPLTTPVATYPDALNVVGTGVGTLNGKPIRMETESWFVKGRGNVKNVFRSTTAGQTSTTTLVEAK